MDAMEENPARQSRVTTSPAMCGRDAPGGRFHERAVPSELRSQLLATSQVSVRSNPSDCDSVKSSYKEDLEGDVKTRTAAVKEVTSQVFSGSEKIQQLFRSVPGVRMMQQLQSRPVPTKPLSGPLSEVRKDMLNSGLSSTAAKTSPSQAFASRTSVSDIYVTASSAGEWVSRFQALQDVSASHREVASKVVGHIHKLIPKAKDFMDPEVENRLSQAIESDLEVSRELLAKHAQGLIGSDLAELRVIKAENKKMADSIAKMNKQYTKELATLKEAIRTRTENGPEHIKKVMGSDVYEPLMFLSSEQRTCCLTILEEKLKALFSSDPRIKETANKASMSRLEDDFKRERMASLEKKIEELTQQLAESRETVIQLQAALQDADGSMTPQKADSNSSSDVIIDMSAPKDVSRSSGSGNPQAPAGKPRPGRRPGSGVVAAAR
mmetsp:Transcript_97611/g.173856  ORF Transcript_97611/g.173856 Transcript_97611/m.173856 type:complete len:437 (-) Transcript_97611:76-1386(-)